MADDVASETAMQMVALSGPARPGQLALGPVAGPGASGTAEDALLRTTGTDEPEEQTSGTPRSRGDFNANNVIMWLKQRTGHHSQTPRARERIRALERKRLGATNAGVGGSIPERRSIIGLDLTVRPIGHMSASGEGSASGVAVEIASGGSLYSSHRSSQHSMHYLREHIRNETINEEPSTLVRPAKHAPEPTPNVHANLQKQHRFAAQEKRTVSLDRERLATRSVGVGVVGSRLLLTHPNLTGVGGQQQRLTPQAVAEMERCSSLSYMPWISALASLRKGEKSAASVGGDAGGGGAGSTSTAMTAPHLRPHEVYSLFRAENLPQIRQELQRLTLQKRTSRGVNGRRIHMPVPVRAVRFLDATNEVEVYANGLPLAEGVSDAGAMSLERMTYGGPGSRSGNSSTVPLSDAASASSRVQTPNSVSNGRKEQLELLVTNSLSGLSVDQDMYQHMNTPQSSSCGVFQMRRNWKGSESMLQRPRQPQLRTAGFKRADDAGPIDDIKSDLSISGIRSARTPRRQSPAAAAMAAASGNRNGNGNGLGHGGGMATGAGTLNEPQLEIQSVSGEVLERHNSSPIGQTIQ